MSGMGFFEFKVDLLVRPEVLKRSSAFGAQLSSDDIINAQQVKALFLKMFEIEIGYTESFFGAMGASAASGS
jgi:hypothetical protein